MLFPATAVAGLHKIGVLEVEYENRTTDADGWVHVDTSQREWLSDHQTRVVSRRTGEGPDEASWFTEYDTLWTYIPIDDGRHAGFSESTETSDRSPGATLWRSYEERPHRFEADAGGAVLCWYCGYAKDSNVFPPYEPPFERSEVGSIPADSIFAITYDANGGDGAPEPQTKLAGKDVELSAQIPELEDLYFLGWDANKRASEPTYKRGETHLYDEDANLALFAVWGRMYSISYSANGGGEVPDPHTKEPGVPAALSAHIPEREGYAFLGWDAYRNTAKAPTYGRDQENLYEADKDIRLYAIWARTYAVAFDANGGDGEPGEQTKVAQVPLTLTQDQPTRDGYDFVGWGTSAKAAKAAFRGGDEYKTDRSVTLYAVWSEARAPKPPLDPQALLRYIVERDAGILEQTSSSKFNASDTMTINDQKVKTINSTWFVRAKLKDLFDGKQDPGRSGWKNHTKAGFSGYDVQVYDADVLASESDAGFLAALGDPGPDAKIVLYMSSFTLMVDAIMDGKVYYTDNREATIAHYGNMPIVVRVEEIAAFAAYCADHGTRVERAVVLTEQ